MKDSTTLLCAHIEYSMRNATKTNLLPYWFYFCLSIYVWL